MGRSPCCAKVGLRRGPWSTQEDSLLTEFIAQNGEGQWRSLPKKAGLLRCGKSCRLRWMNYLRPGIKRGNIDQDEEDLIVRLHGLLGNRWSLIAGRLPGRTDNEIKNYWNTHLLKKLNNAGIHPNPRKNLLKPAKVKKSAAADKEKVVKTPVVKECSGKLEEEEDPKVGDQESADDATAPKTKVFSPKPIKISSAFSRTGSVDSFQSGTSSSDVDCLGCRATQVVPVPTDWPIEVGDTNMKECGGEYDYLGDYESFLRQPGSDSSGESPMLDLDQVYDEYLQLLLQN